MASLSSGVLLKLLHDMDLSSSASDDDASASSTNELPSQSKRNKPSLLQITSILPAFQTNNADDLSPDRGFYLRLSDASHSAYAALPKEHDDLILSDQLRIGQLIYVSRFDSSDPVPVLRGVRPLPARLPLPAETSDLDPVRLSPLLPPPKLPRHTRTASTVTKCRSNNTSPVNAMVKRRELQRGSSDVISELTKISVACVDEGYDSDSSRFSSTSSSSSYSSSSCVLRRKVRKSWGEQGRINGDRKRDLKPLLRGRSASVSPNKLAANHGIIRPKDRVKDDLLAIKKEADAFKVLGSSIKRRTNVECSCLSSSSSSFTDTKWSDNTVIWASLPSSLVKHGKEVLRQRNLALHAAIEGLQEACASEKLLQCLSIYSNIKSNKENDPQDLVDSFLNYYSDLSDARAVAQSLSQLNALNSLSDANIGSVQLSTERRKCAISWIKAALESNLQRAPLSTQNESSDISSTDGEYPDRDRTCITCKQVKKGEVLPTRDTSLVAHGLAKMLQSECNRWFLSYIEKFLDLENETACISDDSRVASLLCQLKRVDSWLDSVSCKDGSKDRSAQEVEEVEACGRVRKKIYRLLLRHVESAAFALESMSITDEVAQDA